MALCSLRICRTRLRPIPDPPSLVVSNVFAWPVAWFFMQMWLQDYPYRTKPDVLIFVASAGLTVLIALLVSFLQAWRAANANPAVSLKYEYRN